MLSSAKFVSFASPVSFCEKNVNCFYQCCTFLWCVHFHNTFLKTFWYDEISHVILFIHCMKSSETKDDLRSAYSIQVVAQSFLGSKQSNREKVIKIKISCYWILYWGIKIAMFLVKFTEFNFVCKRRSLKVAESGRSNGEILKTPK